MVQRRDTWLAVGLFLLAAACGDDPTGPAPAGLRAMEVIDQARSRTIPFDLWYPATDDSTVETRALSGIFPARVAVDAPVADGPPRPLVLLSHGSGGGRADQSWLAERLVEGGFIVAAVEHPGNRFGDDSPEGVVAIWRRPPDVSSVLDRLLADPEWAPRIDATRVGAAGHSSGGYTVIALAGARYDLGFVGSYCAGPSAGPDCSLAADVDFDAIPDVSAASQSYRDPRVRSVFAMAPAVGQGFAREGLDSVATPVHIVGSIDDELTLFPLNAAHYAMGIPSAQLTTVSPGGHFVYMPVCNDLGREVAALVCVDPDPATNRRAIHERVAALAVDFFRETLVSSSGR